MYFLFEVFMVQNENEGEFLWGTFDVFDLLQYMCFACRHLSHKDVYFAAKFTVIFCHHNWPSMNFFIDLLRWFIRLQLARNTKLKI